MRRPLEGIKVLDLTHGVAGPYCSMVLGDLGADVIKVEMPGRGDPTRFMNVSDKFNDDAQYVGGDYFLGVNRNKRSVGIDMKTEEGRKLCEELAVWADLVIQNFRPGVTKRLGLDYASLKKVNPRVIYANISAYGMDGSFADKAGMDIAVQARSGVLRITGTPDSDEPVRPGSSIADLGGGIYLATAVLAALFDRERTGVGQEVSVSLLDATMSMLINYSVAVMDGGAKIAPLGSGHPQLAPYQAFKTKDGFVVMATGTNKIYRTFCDSIGRPDLASDPRYASNQTRVKNRTALVADLNAVFSQKTTAEWIAHLEATDIPCAPVYTLEEAYEDLKNTSPAMVQTVPHKRLGKLSQLGAPFKFSNAVADIRLPPPMLCEHTDEVLTTILRRTPEDLEKLRAAKVI